MVRLFDILFDQPDIAVHTKTSSGGCFYLQFGTSMDFFWPWVKSTMLLTVLQQNSFTFFQRIC